MRVSGPAVVAVEYAQRSDFADARRSPPTTVGPDTDCTATFHLTGLEPDVDYFHRGLVIGLGGRIVTSRAARFRTAPLVPRPFRIAWSADMDAGRQPFTLLERVASAQPDRFLLLGDTIYADLPPGRFVRTLAGYRAKHRENRADPHLLALLAAVPVSAIWDDHEVENDFDASHPATEAGRQAFREYWGLPVDAVPTLYRRLQWSPLVDVFILDCRSYRSPGRTPDGPGKTMLGATQKQWLEDGLATSSAVFKLVASSVPFLASSGPDTWGGYTAERDELREFFRARRLRNVVVLSGDIHMAVDVTDRASGVREFVAGPIAATPQCAMHPESRTILEQRGLPHVCDEYNFGLVTVRPDPPALDVRIVDTAGATRLSASISGG